MQFANSSMIFLNVLLKLHKKSLLVRPMCLVNYVGIFKCQKSRLIQCIVLSTSYDTGVWLSRTLAMSRVFWALLVGHLEAQKQAERIHKYFLSSNCLWLQLLNRQFIVQTNKQKINKPFNHQVQLIKSEKLTVESQNFCFGHSYLGTCFPGLFRCEYSRQQLGSFCSDNQK